MTINARVLISSLGGTKTARTNDTAIEREEWEGSLTRDLLSSLDEEGKVPLSRRFTESNYLLFYPHSGCTNQIIALSKAAELARFVNRTLVLPPVMPHCPDGPKKYAWGCFANTKPEKATIRVLSSAFKSIVAGRQRFPSFTEIIDFDLFPMEYKFVEDFMDMFLDYHGIGAEAANFTMAGDAEEQHSMVKRLILDQFHIGNKSSELHELMYSIPGEGHNQAVEMLFRENFPEERSRVAVVGSCYRVNMLNSHLVKEEPLPVERPFVQPTENFLMVLGHILLHIRTDFVAAHVRIPDIYVWEPERLGPDCTQRRDLRETFSNLFKKIEGEAALHVPFNSTTDVHDSSNDDGNSSRIIYLGSNLDRAKECFKTMLSWYSLYNERKNLVRGTNSTGTAQQPTPLTVSTKSSNSINSESAITLEDVVADNPNNIQELMGQIRPEESTKELVLDQLLLGIARVLVTENGMEIGSTFTRMLQCRHDHRKDVLSSIRRSNNPLLKPH